MNSIIASPLFGILISLVGFEAGCRIYKKTNMSIFNPLMIGIIFVIMFLKAFHIDLKDYDKGGQLISFFLSPATVILAVPLYKKMKLLKENALPIIAGITCGSLFGMVAVLLLCNAFGLSKILNASMLPKSVTVPIGMEISKQLGGNPSITVGVIILTGIIGSVIGPHICKFCRIKDEVAVGIAIGTASHAVGTTKAMELGETEGAMSSLAIGVAGLITVFLAPLVMNIVGKLI